MMKGVVARFSVGWPKCFDLSCFIDCDVSGVHLGELLLRRTSDITPLSRAWRVLARGSGLEVFHRAFQLDRSRTYSAAAFEELRGASGQGSVRSPCASPQCRA